jgi:AcrR family transcriptional regulator
MDSVSGEAARTAPLPRAEREQRVLDVAADLFYARGVHEVGMDELIRATGFGKATVYRLFATKDELVGAYLRRLASDILAAIDRDVQAHADDPRAALQAILSAVADDIARPTFRGCPFNNASIEFADPAHPARVAAREYRAELLLRLRDLTDRLTSEGGEALASQLALLIDGMYVNAAHLGPRGPAAAGPALADALIEAARG